MKNEGLKLIKAEISNFKNITHKSVDFGGKSAIIVGANGVGKSSLIQALLSPVNSKMVPAKAIKNGEEKASIELKLGGTLNGEEQVYNIAMYFSEKNQKGRIVITDEDGGNIPGAKSMVDSIVGNIGFDILEFIGLGLTPEGKPSKSGVKQQIEILKQFLPVEAQKNLHNLDIEKATIYDNRTEINKDIKSNELKLKNMEMDPELIEKYSERLDDTDVKAKMSKIGDEVSKYDQVVSGLNMKKDRKNYVDEEIIKLQKKLEDFQTEQKELSEHIEKGNKWLEGRERPSMDALSKELEEINNHNDMHKKVLECKEFHKNVSDLKGEADGITERLGAIEIEKKGVFTANPLPVKDLSFTEDEIQYKGLPFNENQHPSSTIIGVGLKIAMAMNPNLRLLVIKDGSLLDKKVLNYILKMVESKGYQVFIEMVDYSGEKDLTIEFVEGQVK